MDALAEWLGRRPAKPTVRGQKCGLGARHVTRRLFKSTFVNFAGLATKANADRSLRGLMDKAPPSAYPDTLPSGNRSEPGRDAGSIPAAGRFAIQSFWPELGATQTRWVNAVAPAELKCVCRFRVAMRERAVLEI